MPEYNGAKYSLYPRKQGGKWVCEYIIETIGKDYLIGQRDSADGMYDSRKEAEDAAKIKVKRWIDKSI